MTEEKKVIDFNLLAQECELLTTPDISVVLEKLEALESRFEEEDLVMIYNYFFTLPLSDDVVMQIIRCCDKYRNKLSISPILDMLLNKEKSQNVRIMCAKALANFKDTSVVTPLLYCLNNKDENYKLRLACADALGRVGDKYAVSPLIDIVSDEDEKSVYVRESAAVALGMLGDTRAVDALVSILETKKGFMDKFTFFKERVIEVLRKFNFTSDKVINALEHALDDEAPCIRINAIESLMESENERASELIKRKLSDENDEVKENALIALYNMHGREILDEVLENEAYGNFLHNKAQELIDEYETEVEE